ncbi:MAG: ThuA domain-containing protein [Pedobacter sp.]|uniref:ThuA domain-containing protein n=1 Tax=Pedobacter sp. TaxID=1411316 RepID=UPI002806927B|nr:ThuA domain-containing protein [Pedobacter sp.]MDQ8006021.1 ThuA domain-containing protein [Pedobacter sp.]
MRKIKLVGAILLGLLLIFNLDVSAQKSKKTNKILVFSLTKSYRHKSIKDGILAIRKLGLENNFEIDTSESVSSFTKENLSKYRTLIFLNPTGSNVFSDDQKQALKTYINNGGGLVGIHAATDFCFEWEWYGKMIGAFFTNHPKVQQAKLVSVYPKHKLMKGMPGSWLHTDEWYNFKSFNKDVTVLVKVDETSYQGGKMDNDHPIVWCHKFDGGRVFYTGLGHTPEAYTNELFLKQLLMGIKWTMRK